MRHWLTGIGLLCLVAWVVPGRALSTNASSGSATVESGGISPEFTPTVPATQESVSTVPPTAVSSSALTPTLDPLDPRTSFSMIIATLQAAGALPYGGRLLFSVPEGYAVTNSAGDNFLPLGGGQTTQDFVLGVQLGWYSVGRGSACGLSFRAGSVDWRSVLLTDDGHLLLTRQVSTTRTINADLPISPFSGKPFKNVLWLAASGSAISVYLNGQLQTRIVDDTTRGSFALEVYNAVDNGLVTDCRYRNLWIWSYDGSSTITPSLTVTNSH